MPRSARTCEAATTRSGPGGRGDHRYRHAGRLLGGQGGPAGERTLARSIEELYDEWEREARRVAVTVGEARAELVRAERQIHLDGIMREGSRNVSLGLGVVGGVGASTVLGRTAIRGARTVRATRRLSTLEGRWTTAASFYDERRLARRERRLMMREANRPLKRPIRQGRSAVRRERHALRTQRSLTSAGRALQTSAR